MNQDNSLFRRTATTVALLFGLLFYAFLRETKISELKAEIDELTHALGTLTAERDTLQEKYNALVATHDSTLVELAAVRDTLAMARQEVKALQLKVKAHEKTIRGIREEMGKKERELRQLREKLDAAEREAEGRSNWKIRELEREVAERDAQIRQLKALLKDEETKRNAVEAENRRYQEDVVRMQKVKKVVASTQVSFNAVRCRSEDGGIKKLNGDGTNWAHTDIELALENPDPALIEGAEFELVISDVDTGDLLPYQESSANYPSDAETRGRVFRWSKNPVRLRFVNLQPKTGKNYEAIVLYRNEGKSYPIGDGIMLIQDGKVLD